jgi:hypothetical protein
LCDKRFERLERFSQHCGVFLTVVSEPPFPQSISPNTIIGDVGFGVRDDVLDVLSRSQLHPASEELLRDYRGDFLILDNSRHSFALR